ncbi:class I SAM-dependent methyltransferase [bacterium]|nr:class I SAM-dependent methyltransferase [bacterium]
MSFSNEWDDVYKNNLQLSIFPWSDLVSFVMRHVKPATGLKVLELGCGAGANISLFQHLKSDYFAIEGGSSIVSILHKQFPELKDKIICGDFTHNIPFQETFDLIVDRSSLIHNNVTSIQKTLKMVYDRLKQGGHYIGIDWFSTLHSAFNKGETCDDSYTKHNFKEGQFRDIGKVHFSDEPHLRELLKDYKIKVIELKTILQKEPATGHQFSSWNFVAQKT